jgi:hypothetical protein
MPAKQFEPYAPSPPELCGVNNFTEVYGAPPAWGWADTDCANEFISMCRIQSGCCGAGPAARPAAHRAAAQAVPSLTLCAALGACC